VLQFGAWVADEVLAPVPHRQHAFTVPKILRVYFRDRVFQVLLRERRIDETLIRTLLGWRHSGLLRSAE